MVSLLVGCGEDTLVGSYHIILKLTHRLEVHTSNIVERLARLAQSILGRTLEQPTILVKVRAKHRECRYLGKGVEEGCREIKNLKSIPDALVVVDPKTEHNAVLEARKLNIPIFGLVDTNCDPEDVDYVIPANDDAIRSVKLIVATLANAVVEANGGTPIEVVFTDEPVAEEQRPRRNNRDGKGGHGKKFQKPNFKKEEVKTEQPVAEVKEEAAPVVEENKEVVAEVAEEAPKKVRKPRAKKEEAVEAPAEEAKAE